MRAARRGRRGAGSENQPQRAPFISRALAPYDLLDEENLEQIEAAAERIMSEIGFEFRDDPQVVELFRSAGAEVQSKAENIWRLRFAPGMIREIMTSAPAEFTQYARNRANNVQIGGSHTVFAPSYGSPFVMDLDKGRRYGTLQDFENFVKLGQSSAWLHHSGGTVCEPTDVAVNKRHLDMVYAHIRFSDRAFLGSVTAPERAQDSIEMARILFGEQFVEKNCVIMGNFNTTSPLVIDGITSRGIRAYAQAGQGSIHLPFLLGGAVAPLTIAGAVAQNLAETLVSAAIAQLVRPGAPVIIATFLASMDMKSGSPTFGTPEPALGSLVMGQLARRLKLPLRSAGSFTTSKLPDAQAMQQSMMSMLSAVQSGANYLLHSAGFLDGLLSMSYEKFVMDTDVLGALTAYLGGVEVTEETLAVDALAENGPGEHLFGAAHTLRHYKTAFWAAELDDNRPWETWEEQGGEDMASRANKRWKKLLADYQAPVLDSGVDEALKAYVASKKAAVPDAWY